MNTAFGTDNASSSTDAAMSRKLVISNLSELPPAPVRDRTSALFLIELREGNNRRKTQAIATLRKQGAFNRTGELRPARLARAAA
jgi:hypothetical protein